MRDRNMEHAYPHDLQPTVVLAYCCLLACPLYIAGEDITSTIGYEYEEVANMTPFKRFGISGRAGRGLGWDHTMKARSSTCRCVRWAQLLVLSTCGDVRVWQAAGFGLGEWHGTQS